VREVEALLFLKKKQQKNFFESGPWVRAFSGAHVPGAAEQNFFGSFFQKRTASFP
jgi:hypothetical protein